MPLWSLRHRQPLLSLSRQNRRLGEWRFLHLLNRRLLFLRLRHPHRLSLPALPRRLRLNLAKRPSRHR